MCTPTLPMVGKISCSRDIEVRDWRRPDPGFSNCSTRARCAVCLLRWNTWPWIQLGTRSASSTPCLPRSEPLPLLLGYRDQAGVGLGRDAADLLEVVELERRELGRVAVE